MRCARARRLHKNANLVKDISHFFCRKCIFFFHRSAVDEEQRSYPLQFKNFLLDSTCMKRRLFVWFFVVVLVLVWVYDAPRWMSLASRVLHDPSILMNVSSTNSDSTNAPRAQAAAARVKPTLSVELAAKGLHWGDPVFLRAFKEEGELELFVQDRKSKQFVLLKCYKIAQQSGELGPKQREGDGQVPEGFYHAGRSAMKPDSTYHLAINCGYPNAYDRAHERTGSFIMIHGNCVSIGCLAMTDPLIEEIYSLCDAALQGGQSFFRIHLFPFRMSKERLATTTENPWHEFWQNLKVGYDHFETHRVPPDVEVKNLRYEFSPIHAAPNP